ncbi:hypothetical protein MP638_001285 [Amoeboaphelidium occidentale]|nr:hypothetical protein MP638_001285 [Amoeboaphelidium occidentale]
MATTANSGIQTLLEAEKEAAKVVAKARQYRVQRLKDAKTEAVKEINTLKAQKEKEYEDISKKLSASDATSKVDVETDEKIKALKEAFNKNKDSVIQKLLDTVCRVEPSIHPNLRQ